MLSVSLFRSGLARDKGLYYFTTSLIIHLHLFSDLTALLNVYVRPFLNTTNNKIYSIFLGKRLSFVSLIMLFTIFYFMNYFLK